VRVTGRPKIVILGGGPNRIGQGIEFDYCCVQASFACREMDLESVMINSNPETVSTDYDTSDLLFFEPLTLEDTLNVIERLNGGGIEVSARSGAVAGVIVQFGGQTPLNLAHGLDEAGVPIIGTSLESIDLAEDRDRFKALLHELGLKQPDSGVAYSLDEAVKVARSIGYPVMVRPSYVLGGRGMEMCFDEAALREYMVAAVNVSELARQPVLIDRFLSEAVEIDVDVISDFAPLDQSDNPLLTRADDESRALVCGVMEHTEEAGIHSGDSMCTIPPVVLAPSIRRIIGDHARLLAQRLRVRGLMNVQMAVKAEEVYIIEVNPRASRTVPYVAKSKGVPWARMAARIMMGDSIARLGLEEIPDSGFFSVKVPAFPFDRFPGVDVVLGPEMRSTGEVMGIHRSHAVALAKALMSAGVTLPTEGDVFLSVRDDDKPRVVDLARSLVSMGFRVFTTSGTREFLADHSIDTEPVPKISEGARPNINDLISNGDIHLIINTATRKGAHTDEGQLRALAVRAGVPMITTTTGGRAAVRAIEALRAGAWSVAAIQDYFPELARPEAGAVVADRTSHALA